MDWERFWEDFPPYMRPPVAKNAQEAADIEFYYQTLAKQLDEAAKKLDECASSASIPD